MFQSSSGSFACDPRETFELPRAALLDLDFVDDALLRDPLRLLFLLTTLEPLCQLPQSFVNDQTDLSMRGSTEVKGHDSHLAENLTQPESDHQITPEPEKEEEEEEQEEEIKEEQDDKSVQPSHSVKSKSTKSKASSQKTQSHKSQHETAN
ncbi:MAG: hypothetical protein EZS28_046049, partial [Streblomastix strix]